MPHRYIFVVGLHRSGTSLLTRLIDHKNAAPRQLAGDLPCLPAAQVLRDEDLLAHPCTRSARLFRRR